MTKYSTGSSNDPDPNDDSASCSLCGETENLTTGEIAGTKVVVCKSCANKDDSNGQNTDSGNNSRDYNTNNRTSNDRDQNTDGESGYTITNPDSSWVEESRPAYGNTDTPYMVSDYGKKVTDSLASEDESVESVAKSLDLDVETVEAVANGNAVSSGVNRESIEKIAEYFNIDLIDER